MNRLDMVTPIKIVRTRLGGETGGNPSEEQNGRLQSAVDWQ
ncbi:MAG: hypothetical protein QF749_07055 [Verrucomicrobiota bacterium]|nr:hypothetical protein [Verrucomicrobiota bacterium]MDP6250941.1 hypothetical protein [Verrucomicrobiota bacterium]MDP7178038.1 hypothetical protein [Verrucomicrobiota bacterium]MDP7290820.1 hypothetical protein [Verrucomicrobiota bacterium]MDP7441448.1 hypothetical protein [Verrucomicrobiota bacterium]